MIERMIVRLIGDGTSFMRMMRDASSITRQFGVTITQIGRSVTRLGRNLTLFLTAPIIALGVSSLKASISMETMLIRLQALVGSAKKGAEQFEKIKKFSIPSPFLLQDLLNINNLLVGFGMSADQAFDSLLMLSDVASLTTNNFRRLALAYGQAFADQRVMGRDINQFVNSSVPLLKMLEDTIGLTGKEIRKMSSEGELSFELLENAMRAATAAGGLFFRGTAILAETTKGKLSQFADRVFLVKASFGDLLKEGFQPLLEKALELSEKMEDLDEGFRRQIISAFKLAAVIGPLVLIFGIGVIFLGQTVTLISTLSGGLLRLGIAASKALGPYGTLAALIVGGAAVGVTATTALKSGGEKKGFAGFLDTLDLIRERIITVIRIAAKSFALIFGAVGREFTRDLGKNFISLFFNAIPFVDKVFQFIVEQFNSLVSGRKGSLVKQSLLQDILDEYERGFATGLGFDEVAARIRDVIIPEEMENERIRRGSVTPAPGHADRVRKVREKAENELRRANRALANFDMGSQGVDMRRFIDRAIRPNLDRRDGAVQFFSPVPTVDVETIKDRRPPTPAEFLGDVREAAQKEMITVLEDSKELLIIIKNFIKDFDLKAADL